jgi:hypothetical protein
MFTIVVATLSVNIAANVVFARKRFCERFPAAYFLSHRWFDHRYRRYPDAAVDPAR